MKPQQQLLQHNQTQNGDCFRTCLAILLDMDAIEVPHFMKDANGDEDAENHLGEAEDWLNQIGYTLHFTPFDGKLKDILFIQASLNKNQYYILTGRSANDCNHSVVCCNDKVVCDPSLNGSGIVGPAESEGEKYYWVGVLMPINQKLIGE